MDMSQVTGIKMGRARWRRPVVAMGGLAVLGGLIATAPPAVGDPQDPAPPPAPPGQAVAQSAAGGSDVPPNGMPHLSSPSNLPPDTTTDTPVDSQSDKLNYAREVWHAIQDQDITMGQGLLMLAQQPMDATPQTGMPINPQPPPGQ